MTSMKNVMACALMGVLFFGAGAAYAQSSHPNDCISNTTGPGDCQHQVTSYTGAPSPAISKGIRLDAGIQDVLFNSYPALTPVFISNDGDKHLFVPQATQPAFEAFLNNAPSNNLGVHVRNAIPQAPYTTTPTPWPVACNLAMAPSEINVNVPDVSDYHPATVGSDSLVVVDTYTRKNDAPNKTQVKITKAPDGSDIEFFAAPRRECTSDNRYNEECARVTYKEKQELNFEANNALAWTLNVNPPTAKNLYVKVGASDWVQTNDCTEGKYAPPMDAVCCVECSSSLMCERGLSKDPDPASIEWHTEYVKWTCLGINGGADATCLRRREGKAACTSPWGTYVAPGMSIIAYETTGTTCNAEVRTCDYASAMSLDGSGNLITGAYNAGVLSGSYTNRYCSVCDQSFLGATLADCPSPEGARGLFYNLGNGYSAFWPNARPDAHTAANRIPGIEVYTTQLDIDHQNYTVSRYGDTVPTSFFGACYDATWFASGSGNYTFVSMADDILALYIDGVFIGQNSYGYVSNTLFINTTGDGKGVHPGYLFTGPTAASSGAMGTFNFLGEVAMPFRTVNLASGRHSVQIKYVQNWPTGMGAKIWVMPVGTTYTQNAAGTVPPPSVVYLMRLLAPQEGSPTVCP